MSKAPYKIVLILTILSLISCQKIMHTGYPSPERIEKKISKGFSEAQVLAILSNPTIKDDFDNTWYYVRIDGKSSALHDFNPLSKIICRIKFANGVVSEIKTYTEAMK